MISPAGARARKKPTMRLDFAVFVRVFSFLYTFTTLRYGRIYTRVYV